MLNLPLSNTDFFSQYFEQKPLLCNAVIAENLVGLADLDRLLNTLEPDERRLQMFLQGQVPPPHFLDEVVELGRPRMRINKDGFYSLLTHGATLVINQAEDVSVTFKRLCAEIGNFVHQTTSSNAYLCFNSPANAGKAGTFGKHWDTHDVFAIQLFGKKRWQLFEPTLPLPLSNQTSSSFGLPPNSTPSFECTLSEGDLLYIPRGWWHKVTPLDVDSLHLSIGTYPPTVIDYLNWVCKNKLPPILAARKTCPLKTNDTSLNLVIEQLTQLAKQQQNLDAFHREQRVNAQHTGEFHTALLLKKAKITDDHLLSLNNCIVDNHNQIVIHNATVNVNAIGRLLIQLLQPNNELSWGDIRQYLIHIPDDPLMETAMDLNRFDIVNIRLPETR